MYYVVCYLVDIPYILKRTISLLCGIKANLALVRVLVPIRSC